MKNIKIKGAAILLSFLLEGTLTAQVGKPFIHDPSTIVECDESITHLEQAEGD